MGFREKIDLSCEVFRVNRMFGYFQHAHFIAIIIAGVGKRDAYQMVHGDLHPFGTALRFTGPVPADYRQ